MLSKRIIAVARGRGLLRAQNLQTAALSKSWCVASSIYIVLLPNGLLGLLLPAMQGAPNSTPLASCRVSQLSFGWIASSRTDIRLLGIAETVKVPQMAESISEGTLKSWNKQVGDSVAADEEVATIETDKVRSTLPCLVGFELRDGLMGN